MIFFMLLLRCVASSPTGPTSNPATSRPPAIAIDPEPVTPSDGTSATGPTPPRGIVVTPAEKEPEDDGEGDATESLSNPRLINISVKLQLRLLIDSTFAV